jgi:hypothetical protein
MTSLCALVLSFAEFRSDCAETVRCVASINADVAFQYIVKCIEEQLLKPAINTLAGNICVILRSVAMHVLFVTL